MPILDNRRSSTTTLLMLLFCAVVFLAEPRAQAQTNYGAVVGTLTDSSEAALVGAQVELENNGTNATMTTKTGGGGTYSFLNLNPGTYSVKVSQTGFESITKSNVDVQIGGATDRKSVV